MTGIKRWFGTGFASKQEIENQKDEQYKKLNEELRLRGKRPLDREKMEEDDRKTREREYWKQ